MDKQKRTIYLSSEAWTRLEKAAKADGRSASAFLERLIQSQIAPSTSYYATRLPSHPTPRPQRRIPLDEPTRGPVDE